jgi:hypothetical protein
MTREECLVRLAAGMLSNPACDPLKVCAVDVAFQARRILDRLMPERPPERPLEPVTLPAKGPNGKPATVHDGPWLLRTAVARGALDWFLLFGQDHGFPKHLAEWSPVMVGLAVEARQRVVAAAAGVSH